MEPFDWLEVRGYRLEVHNDVQAIGIMTLDYIFECQWCIYVLCTCHECQCCMCVCWVLVMNVNVAYSSQKSGLSIYHSCILVTNSGVVFVTNFSAVSRISATDSVVARFCVYITHKISSTEKKPVNMLWCSRHHLYPTQPLVWIHFHFMKKLQI